MNEAITPAERFEFAVSSVFRHEGGYSCHRKDPGGATNYGISLRFLKASGIDIDMDGDIDLYDILALDPLKAKEIYKKFWWDKYNYEAINSLSIATKIFDMAVNMGAPQAHKITQRAVNFCGYTLAVDGILGGKSLSSINEICLHGREDDLKAEIIDDQKWFYEHLVEQNPDLKVFLKGWLNRAND